MKSIDLSDYKIVFNNIKNILTLSTYHKIIIILLIKILCQIILNNPIVYINDNISNNVIDYINCSAMNIKMNEYKIYFDNFINNFINNKQIYNELLYVFQQYIKLSKFIICYDLILDKIDDIEELKLT